MFDEMYQELILEHARNKAHRGTLDGEVYSAHLRNPLCGDEIVLTAKFDDGKLSEVKFDGHGCLISQAAASIMSDLSRGKNREELQALVEQFRSFMGHGKTELALEQLGDLTLLEGVKSLPSRIRCALLAFEALEEILNSNREPAAAQPNKPQQ